MMAFLAGEISIMASSSQLALHFQAQDSQTRSGSLAWAGLGERSLPGRLPRWLLGGFAVQRCGPSTMVSASALALFIPGKLLLPTPWAGPGKKGVA